MALEQPTELTVVKVVEHGLMTREVYAVDNDGNVWKCTEGMGDMKWKLFKRADEVAR
jgi:hypothetical protein